MKKVAGESQESTEDRGDVVETKGVVKKGGIVTTGLKVDGGKEIKWPVSQDKEEGGSAPGKGLLFGGIEPASSEFTRLGGRKEIVQNPVSQRKKNLVRKRGKIHSDIYGKGRV